MPNLKNILLAKWHLIKNQPVLREIFKDPPVLSYRNGRSLKDILFRAKHFNDNTNGPMGVVYFIHNHYVMVGSFCGGHCVVGHSVVGAHCGGYPMVVNVPNPARRA